LHVPSLPRLFARAHRQAPNHAWHSLTPAPYRARACLLAEYKVTRSRVVVMEPSELAARTTDRVRLLPLLRSARGKHAGNRVRVLCVLLSSACLLGGATPAARRSHLTHRPHPKQAVLQHANRLVSAAAASSGPGVKGRLSPCGAGAVLSSLRRAARAHVLAARGSEVSLAQIATLVMAREQNHSMHTAGRPLLSERAGTTPALLLLHAP